MLSPDPNFAPADGETAITEISFLPDGRICLFGASREVLEILGTLNLHDNGLDARLAALGQAQLPMNQKSAERHD